MHRGGWSSLAWQSSGGGALVGVAYREAAHETEGERRWMSGRNENEQLRVLLPAPKAQGSVWDLDLVLKGRRVSVPWLVAGGADLPSRSPASPRQCATRTRPRRRW